MTNGLKLFKCPVNAVIPNTYYTVLLVLCAVMVTNASIFVVVRAGNKTANEERSGNLSEGIQCGEEQIPPDPSLLVMRS